MRGYEVVELGTEFFYIQNMVRPVFVFTTRGVNLKAVIV